MKTYAVQIDDDKVVREIEEIARVQGAEPSELVAVLTAQAVAPMSRLARKFDRELRPQN